MTVVTLPKTNSESFLQQFFKLCIAEFGNEEFNKWLAQLQVESFSTGEIIFSAPSKFNRDWVIREFIEKPKNEKGRNLVQLVQEIIPSVKRIAIVHVARPEEQKISNNNQPSAQVVSISKYDNLFAFGAELNPKYTFENFISAKYNKLALSMAKITAGIDAQTILFDDKIPLYIHGSVGVGKTHLAQAIAWKIREQNSGKKVVYLSAEKFMYHFVQSVRNNDVISFKEKMRSIDVLIVDDVQFIAGKESTQQEFMNSFNNLVSDNKQVILVCDRCPSDLENIDEKLKSRISGGMIVNFKNPDYNDRLEILQAKALSSNENISSDIIRFLAEKITTNIRDLEGAIKKLVATKVFLGEEINFENTKNILSDYLKASAKTAPTIAKIQKITAQFYGIKIEDLLSNSRARNFARPRQIAMYLSKNYTSESLPTIGKEFGGKNHATVIHAVKTIQNFMSNDQLFYQEIKTLEEKLIK